ncbi:MAG: hypothetical protein AB4058_03010 [Microcystaceae cyanobacterium]
MRRHLGDRGAEMFYYGIGSLSIAVNVAYFKYSIAPLVMGALLAIVAYRFLAKNRW